MMDWMDMDWMAGPAGLDGLDGRPGREPGLDGLDLMDMIDIEVFRRWSDETPVWGFLAGSCSLCLRLHKFGVDHEPIGEVCDGLRRNEYRLVVRDEDMWEYRKPLRDCDDPRDPRTAWVRTKPDTDDPPF